MITSTTISISWVFGGGITENVIVSSAASVNNGSLERSTLVGLVTSFTLVDLQPLTRYNISVVAVNQFGASSPTTITVETSDLGMDVNLFTRHLLYLQPMYHVWVLL